MRKEYWKKVSLLPFCCSVDVEHPKKRKALMKGSGLDWLQKQWEYRCL